MQREIFLVMHISQVLSGKRLVLFGGSHLMHGMHGVDGSLLGKRSLSGRLDRGVGRFTQMYIIGWRLSAIGRLCVKQAYGKWLCAVDRESEWGDLSRWAITPAAMR
jgi:hypothetical protein